MSERSTGRAVLKIFTYLGIALVGVVVLFAAGYFGGQLLGDRGEKATPIPTATATESPGQLRIMKVPVPANSDCKGCHGTDAISIPNVPTMAHPVEGWTNCLSCHNDTGLVKTAPGHAGIHKEACLMCHKPPTNPETALKRPHHMPDTDCTSCHNGKGSAPLPQLMADRKNCWVCHTDASKANLFDDTGK